MQRFDTRVFLIAASVLVAGCGGGGGGGTNTVAAPAAPQNPAAPANNGANGANGADGKDALADSAESAAKDGFEAGLDYGQALAEAKDKGEDPPERPENPFLEDGQTLSEDEIDSACRKVGDEVEPTEEALDPDAEDPDTEDPEAEDPDEEDPDAEDPDAEETDDKGYDAAAAGQDVTAEPADADAEDPDAEDPDAEDPDAEDPDAEDPDAEDPDADEPDAEDPDDGDDDGALDDDTKRRLAAVWECAFEQGTEAGEVIYEEGALGDAENDDGGIGLEDSGESDEDDGDDPEDEDPDAEEDPQAANCGDGSEYAPLSKLKVERVEGSIRVEVEGTTPTGGFTDARLVTTTEELDDDGVLHLVFCIKPPADDAAVTQATVKHTAIFMWARDHEKVTRVIVEGKSNSKQKSVEALEEDE